jgi:hypothetical protein
MTVAISQYLKTVEQTYTEFPLTVEGLEEAREYLKTRLNPGFRRSVSPWQFDDFDDRCKAERLLLAGDVEGLRQHLLSTAPKW